MHRRLSEEIAGKLQLKWIYRHLPLHKLPGHESSGRAAVLSEICLQQGRFWEFADQVFGQEKALSAAELDALASRLCENPNVVSRLDHGDDPAYLAVNDDLSVAKTLALTQTPTFIVVWPDGRRECLDPRGVIRALRGVP